MRHPYPEPMRRFEWRRYLVRPRHDWTLLFLHIPKTAGSSLRNALSQVYLPTAQLYLYDAPGPGRTMDLDTFEALAPEERSKPRFIAGHFYFGLHTTIPRPAMYVTVIRDPVERVASLYHHYRRVAALGKDTRAGQEGRRILDDEMSLVDWGFGLERIEIDNEVVRRVAGRQDVPFGHCSDDMLADALEKVDEYFAQVLVVEHLDRSVRQLDGVLGTRLPPVGRVNVNEARAPIDAMGPEVLERVRSLNQLDIAFHRAMADRLLTRTS